MHHVVLFSCYLLCTSLCCRLFLFRFCITVYQWLIGSKICSLNIKEVCYQIFLSYHHSFCVLFPIPTSMILYHSTLNGTLIFKNFSVNVTPLKGTSALYSSSLIGNNNKEYVPVWVGTTLVAHDWVS
jgi:hypothetical protein